ALAGIDSSWQRARRPQLETGRPSLFHEDVIFKIGFLVVNQYQELHDLMSYQLRDWLLGCLPQKNQSRQSSDSPEMIASFTIASEFSWGGNLIDVSQEGSDEVGDYRLLVLEIQIEECKLANCSISGKREPIHDRGEVKQIEEGLFGMGMDEAGWRNGQLIRLMI
nr:hypothetical protein [Tanacetum cinerariifolium]